MKLSELKERCQIAKIPYAYGTFTKSVNPPHLTGRVIDTNNLAADNKVWKKFVNFRLELTSIKKDLELEKKIEEKILGDIYWDKHEMYIPSEEVENTSYFFEIEEEI